MKPLILLLKICSLGHVHSHSGRTVAFAGLTISFLTTNNTYIPQFNLDLWLIVLLLSTITEGHRLLYKQIQSNSDFCEKIVPKVSAWDLISILVNLLSAHSWQGLSCKLADLSQRPGAAAGRSNPTPKAKGGGWEDQPHVQRAVAAREQEGLEELSHLEGQEGRWWGDTPRPK